MKSLLLTLFLLCGVQVYAQFGETLFYMNYVDLSLKKHPLLVHLKGNIKTLSIDASKEKQLLDDFNERKPFVYHFENNKLISDSKSQYFYDKAGYLKEIKSGGFSTLYISDSITHQLLSVKCAKHTFKIIETLNDVSIGNKNFMYCTINKYKRVTEFSSGIGGNVYTFEENGDLSSYYSYLIGGRCTYVSHFDKYYNLVYYSCNEEKSLLPYSYSNFDEKGNWQLGQSMSQSKEMEAPFITKRTYEYYPD
jgi:hypothetical protein